MYFEFLILFLEIQSLVGARDHCANNVYKLRRPLKFPTAIENKDRDVLVIGLKGMKIIKSTEMTCQSDPKSPKYERYTYKRGSALEL